MTEDWQSTEQEPERPAPFSPVQQLRLPRFSSQITYGLIALNVLFYAASFMSRQGVTVYGALVPGLVIFEQQWWRLITAGFLHAGALHIIFNMYALYGLGTLMESFFGSRRFIITYAIALFGSSVLVTLLSNLRTPTVGASGAIMGILGALLVFYWKYRDLLVGGRGYLSQLARMAMINIGIGLLPGISMWGHLGGFLAGAAAGAIMTPQYGRPDWVVGRLELQTMGRQAWLKLVLLVLGEFGLLWLALRLRGAS